ncbi:MAG: phage tail tape measure protein [Desulfovibrionaceae bacterium]
MNGSMAVNVLIGASLASGFGSTLQNAVGQIGGLAAGGAMLAGAVSGAANFEHTLKATAITADMTDAQIGKLRTNLRGLAVPESTNQSVAALEKGFNALVSAGMSAVKAEASLYAIGRTATATGAGMEDLAKTAYVLVETLGIAPDALTGELDRLAFAGKAGAFELKDMARYFPMLGAGAKNLGLKGSEAVSTMSAALQIAKRGAGDPSEAANNMANFMKALTSPEVLKNAKDAGINIKKVLRGAWAKGENPFVAVMDAIQAKVGNDPFKIGKIFHDSQVQNFLKPMLADYTEFKKLKTDIESQSAGTVDADFARMMDTTKEQMQALSNTVDMLGDSIGTALLPQTKALLGNLIGVVGALTDFAESSPEVISMAGHVLVCGTAFVALGKSTSMGKTLLSSFTSSGGTWLQGLRNDFRAAQAAAAAQPPLMTRIGNSFRAAGSSARGLGTNIRGMGAALGSIPTRLRAAGGAAGVFRVGLSGLRTGLLGTRVGIMGIGRAIKGLFMTNPLGWLFAAVEFGTMLYDSWEPFRQIVDKIWLGIKKVGGAIGEFFGWGDKGKDAPSPQASSASPSTTPASDDTAFIGPRRPGEGVNKPGTAIEQAQKNKEQLESKMTALQERQVQAPQEQRFKHEIALTVRLPEGVTASSAAHTGASNTTINVRTGQLMAYWRYTLRKASFRGVEFEVESRDTSGGRRLVVHEYPRRDEAYPEDMGRKHHTLSVSAFQFGPEYLGPCNKLLEALEKEGEGEYIDPWGTTHRVVVASYSSTERQQQGGYVSFRITFEESSPSPAHNSTTDSAAKLQQATLSARLAVLQHAIHQWRGLVPDAVIHMTRYLDPLLQACGLLGQGLSLARGVVSLPAVILGQLMHNGLLMPGIGSLNALAATPDALMDLFSNLVSQNVRTEGNNSMGRVQSGLTLARSAGRPAGLSGDIPLLELVAHLTQKTPQNMCTLAEAQLGFALLEATEAVAIHNFDTADEARATEQTLCQGFTALMQEAPDPLYVTLADTRTALVRDIRSRAANLDTLDTVTPLQTLPALLLAYQLYGTAAREEELLRRNPARHPGFLSGGKALIVRKEQKRV